MCGGGGGEGIIFRTRLESGSKLWEATGKWEVGKLSKLTKQNVIWRLKHASVALSRGLLHICCLHVQISAVSFSFFFLLAKKVKRCINIGSRLRPCHHLIILLQ